MFYIIKFIISVDSYSQSIDLHFTNDNQLIRQISLFTIFEIDNKFRYDTLNATTLFAASHRFV
jgi:hypothetical protein